jgi:hypothetical protein
MSALIVSLRSQLAHSSDLCGDGVTGALDCTGPSAAVYNPCRHWLATENHTASTAVVVR